MENLFFGFTVGALLALMLAYVLHVRARRAAETTRRALTKVIESEVLRAYGVVETVAVPETVDDNGDVSPGYSADVRIIADTGVTSAIRALLLLV